MKNKKTLIVTKRIKLDNGKTILVDMPVKPRKDPFLKLAQILSKIPGIQPID